MAKSGLRPRVVLDLGRKGHAPLVLTPTLATWRKLEAVHGGCLGALFQEFQGAFPGRLAMIHNLLYWCAQDSGLEETVSYEKFGEYLYDIGLEQCARVAGELFEDLFKPGQVAIEEGTEDPLG